MCPQAHIHKHTGPNYLLLLLLLLSHFSRVWLCATPETAAHQTPLSLGFSRQEHWSGLPFPFPVHEREKWEWSRSVMLTPSNPMDCSLPGSSVHGIFQARVLEWGAIAFSAKLPNPPTIILHVSYFQTKKILFFESQCFHLLSPTSWQEDEAKTISKEIQYKLMDSNLCYLLLRK